MFTSLVIRSRSLSVEENWFKLLGPNLAGSRDLWRGGRRWPPIWFPWRDLRL